METGNHHQHLSRGALKSSLDKLLVLSPALHQSWSFNTTVRPWQPLSILDLWCAGWEPLHLSAHPLRTVESSAVCNLEVSRGDGCLRHVNIEQNLGDYFQGVSAGLYLLHLLHYLSLLVIWFYLNAILNMIFEVFCQPILILTWRQLCSAAALNITAIIWRCPQLLCGCRDVWVFVTFHRLESWVKAPALVLVTSHFASHLEVFESQCLWQVAGPQD